MPPWVIIPGSGIEPSAARSRSSIRRVDGGQRGMRHMNDHESARIELHGATTVATSMKSSFVAG